MWLISTIQLTRALSHRKVKLIPPVIYPCYWKNSLFNFRASECSQLWLRTSNCIYFIYHVARTTWLFQHINCKVLFLFNSFENKGPIGITISDRIRIIVEANNLASGVIFPRRIVFNVFPRGPPLLARSSSKPIIRIWSEECALASDL